MPPPPPDFQTFLRPWQVELLFFYGNAHSINVNGFENKTKKDSTKQPALRTTFKTAENGHKLLQDIAIESLHDEQNLKISNFFRWYGRLTQVMSIFNPTVKNYIQFSVLFPVTLNKDLTMGWKPF